MSALAALVVAFAVGGAVSAMSRLPDLHPWHHLVTSLEPRAGDIGEGFTLDDYLQREAAVFAEAGRQVDAIVAEGADPLVPNRYVAASRSAPSRFATDFNRTQLVVPPQVRGGALLLHGLTDAPYSMRSIAERLQAAGFVTLSLRMQGHGTVPGGLVGVSWEDWAAAARMGARHVRGAVGPDLPLVVVGYSNGGALAVNYTLEALEDSRLPAPTGLVLLSPMIGVSPVARVARLISLLGPLPFFEKARWLDVVPEYNPFKYNSFPANAGLQTGRFTAAIQSRMTRAAEAGRLAKFPPVLAFQSVVDTTVSTAAVVNLLFSRLPPNGHELVLFDLNRTSGVEVFTRPGAVLPRLTGEGVRPFTVTLVTNHSAATLEVSAMTVASGATTLTEEPLGLRLAARHVLPVARCAAVSRGRPGLRRGQHLARHRWRVAGARHPARREGRADRPHRSAHAGVVEPVLRLPGRPARALGGVPTVI